MYPRRFLKTDTLILNLSRALILKVVLAAIFNLGKVSILNTQKLTYKYPAIDNVPCIVGRYDQ